MAVLWLVWALQKVISSMGLVWWVIRSGGVTAGHRLGRLVIGQLCRLGMTLYISVLVIDWCRAGCISVLVLFRGVIVGHRLGRVVTGLLCRLGKALHLMAWCSLGRLGVTRHW